MDGVLLIELGLLSIELGHLSIGLDGCMSACSCRLLVDAAFELLFPHLYQLLFACLFRGQGILLFCVEEGTHLGKDPIDRRALLQVGSQPALLVDSFEFAQSGEHAVQFLLLHLADLYRVLAEGENFILLLQTDFFQVL